jgi:molecular chaperone GrpE
MSQTPFDEDGVSTDPDAEALHTGNQASDDLARLLAERDDLFNRLARTQAEFQNARRRLDADKDQAVQYANSSLIKALLPVIDNFERAINIDPAKTDVAKLLKGMRIVHDQWLAELGKQQVEQIVPEVGAAFDPLSMQALMQQPTDKYPANHVTQLLQTGYALHGRVLRPAQVAVSKGN